MTSPPAPRHHPTLETLAAFAAGALPAGFDVVAAAHLAACAECRARAAVLEGVGAAILAEAPEARLSGDALAHALARLETPAPEPSRAPARTLEGLLAAAKRRWVAPGVWVAKVDTPHAADDRVYMLGAAPGAATAKHSHRGLEFTQVLQGALEDDGALYRAGDFAECDARVLHRPRAVGEDFCICLFATQGRLAPAGIIGRIAFALAGV